MSVDGQFTERLVDRFVSRSLRLVVVNRIDTAAVKQVLAKLFIHDLFLQLLCIHMTDGRRIIITTQISVCLYFKIKMSTNVLIYFSNVFI